jgi:hypothetical protein
MIGAQSHGLVDILRVKDQEESSKSSWIGRVVFFREDQAEVRFLATVFHWLLANRGNLFTIMLIEERCDKVVITHGFRRRQLR